MAQQNFSTEDIDGSLVALAARDDAVEHGLKDEVTPAERRTGYAFLAQNPLTAILVNAQRSAHSAHAAVA